MPDPFPKRHASFHSPREVPLPSPSRERTQPFFDQQPADDTNQESSWLDRFSSASLPLPSQIPYFALPKAKNEQDHLVCPPLDESSSESSLGSTSSETASSSSMSLPPKQSSSPPPPPQAPARPTSPLPFRAPQPPPTSPRFAAPTPTAMRTRPLSSSSASTSSSAGFPNLPGYTPASPIPSAPYSPSSLSSTFGALPEAPTILEDPPSANHDPSNRAPYEAFLGGGVGGTNAQPPPDSWIQIESLMGEYRLYVRLPGFTREGITLATKRRRILHLVADRWDRDGGACSFFLSLSI